MGRPGDVVYMTVLPPSYAGSEETLCGWEARCRRSRHKLSAEFG